jgi:wyosine [tRNA(Phe)-imidazoG37] synthetase (radical SAM superfamily)
MGIARGCGVLLSTDASQRARPDLIYGPVLSRRYGLVYGVNLLSSLKKNCSWNCVYCQLGASDRRDGDHGFADPAEMRARLDALSLESSPAAFVVCGNGEPTRHPGLDGALAALVDFRDSAAPDVPIVLLTNGSELHRAEVRKALGRVDEISVKLDAGSCETFHRINLPSTPACVHFQARMIRKLHGAVVQSCFLEGAVSNTGEEDLQAWFRALRFAMPGRVDCYTLARPTACRKLHAVSTEWLAALAARVHGELGIAVRAFHQDGIAAEHGKAMPRSAC